MMTTTSHHSNWRTASMAALVVVVAFLPYFNCYRFSFINWDDQLYVSENPQVLRGFSWSGFQWAWSTFHSANWHPLTWLSLQLDATLWGRGPAGFHVVNAVLHALTAGIVFLALRRMTGNAGVSLLVALLWGVHPLRVENVAWISERKDVLSLFCGALALECYSRYVAKPCWQGMTAVTAMMACSLLAKPTLVTLPCCLLLLDYWPLERWRNRTWGRLLLEKIPLFALTLASSIITVAAQSAGGALQTELRFPLETRLANAVLAGSAYLGQTLWPVGLSPYYPHAQPHWTDLQVLGATALVVILTAVCLWSRRRMPWLLFGWLWFLGTLMPVIGVVVQQGDQSRADRYVYWPHLGLLLAVVWGLFELAKRFHLPQRLVTLASATIVILLVAQSYAQAQRWQDSLTLWSHALALNSASPKIWQLRGGALAERNRDAEARQHLERALQLDPSIPTAHHQLGRMLMRLDEVPQAREHFARAAELRPRNAEYHWAEGDAAEWLGRDTDAETAYRKALSLEPGYVPAADQLSLLLERTDRAAEAREVVVSALRVSPRADQLYLALGLVEESLGHTREAAAAFRQASEINPQAAVPAGNFAWRWATSTNVAKRRPQQALQGARQFLGAYPSHPRAPEILAAALAASNRFDEAVTFAEQALKRAHGHPESIQRIKENLAGYRARQRQPQTP